jgi:hypothetical protein
MTVHLAIFLPKIPYTHTVHDRTFGDFPAKDTVYVRFWPTVVFLNAFEPPARAYIVLQRRDYISTKHLFLDG